MLLFGKKLNVIKDCSLVTGLLIYMYLYNAANRVYTKLIGVSGCIMTRYTLSVATHTVTTTTNTESIE
jgi:hypothetical protein